VVRSRFEALAARVPSVTSVRGLGAMMAVELHDGGDPQRPATETVKQIIAACRENGLLVIPAGVHGNVIRVLSPLVITDEQLARGLDILEESVQSLAGAALASVT
jgi:4-aminobutyrate aminotransferase-like enzyme